MEIRKNEIDVGKDAVNIEIKGILFLWSTPLIAVTLSLALHQYLNEVLNINTILVSIYLFDLLGEPIRTLPLVYAQIWDVVISLGRIEVFLKEEQYHSDNIQENCKSDYIIKIDNLSFSWGKQLDYSKNPEELNARNHKQKSEKMPIIA